MATATSLTLTVSLSSSSACCDAASSHCCQCDRSCRPATELDVAVAWLTWWSLRWMAMCSWASLMSKRISDSSQCKASRAFVVHARSRRRDNDFWIDCWADSVACSFCILSANAVEFRCGNAHCWWRWSRRSRLWWLSLCSCICVTDYIASTFCPFGCTGCRTCSHRERAAVYLSKLKSQHSISREQFEIPMCKLTSLTQHKLKLSAHPSFTGQNYLTSGKIYKRLNRAYAIKLVSITI